MITNFLRSQTTNQTTGSSNQTTTTGQPTTGTTQTTGTTGQTTSNAGQTTGTSGQTTSNAGQTTGTSGQTTSNAGQTTGTSGQTTTSTQQTTAKVNVNTASDIVLAALLGGGDEALHTAQEIIQYRETLMYGIEDISELVNQRVISDADYQLIQDYITVTSNVFTIRCVTTADRAGTYGATLRTEAVVDRSTSPCKILYWYQGASN